MKVRDLINHLLDCPMDMDVIVEKIQVQRSAKMFSAAYRLK